MIINVLIDFCGIIKVKSKNGLDGATWNRYRRLGAFAINDKAVPQSFDAYNNNSVNFFLDNPRYIIRIIGTNSGVEGTDAI